jgi:hypothetical protein
VLGQLMLRGNPKYALMELSVATWLKPDDRESQRALVIGFAEQRLDEQARAHLARIEAMDREWRRDTTLAAVVRKMDERSLQRVKVARF